MRKLHLVQDLEFNRKYKERNGVKDYDNYTYMIENQYRSLYEAEEVVSVSDIHNSIVENVLKGYKDLFMERGITPTEAQLDFAKTTAKVLLGEFKRYSYYSCYSGSLWIWKEYNHLCVY